MGKEEFDVVVAGFGFVGAAATTSAAGEGAPVHEIRQRVLKRFWVPIPGLYADGEMDSVFRHL